MSAFSFFLLILATIIAAASVDSGIATAAGLFVDVDTKVETVARSRHPEYATIIDSEHVTSCYDLQCFRLAVARHSGLEKRRLIIIPVANISSESSEDSRRDGNIALSFVGWLDHILFHATLGPELLLVEFPFEEVVADKHALPLPKTSILVDVFGRRDTALSSLLDPRRSYLPRLTLGDHNHKNAKLEIPNFDHESIVSSKNDGDRLLTVDIKFPIGLPYFHILERLKLQLGSSRSSQRPKPCYYSGRFVDKFSEAISEEHQSFFNQLFGERIACYITPILNESIYDELTAWDKCRYFYYLARTVFVPCPIPWQSYLFYEALELGAIPVSSRPAFSSSDFHPSDEPGFHDDYPGPLLDNFSDLSNFASTLYLTKMIIDLDHVAEACKTPGFCAEILDGPLFPLIEFNIKITADEVYKILSSNPGHMYNSLFEIIIDIIQTKVLFWYKRKKIDMNRYLLGKLRSID